MKGLPSILLFAGIVSAAAAPFSPGNPLAGLEQLKEYHRKLRPGSHVLRLECTGKNAASSGYYLGLDSFAAVVPVYERPSAFDLGTIQKPEPAQ